MSSGFAPLARTPRMRASAHRVHGGASSLLRLAQPGASRLPSGPALTEWALRAATLLAPEMVAVTEDTSAALVTPLQPSPSLRVAAAFR